MLQKLGGSEIKLQHPAKQKHAKGRRKSQPRQRQFSHSASDYPSYLNWHLGKGVLNSGPKGCDPQRFTIKTIIDMTPRKRSGRNGFEGFLENCHRWVQYAFPTITKSKYFREAPSLTHEEITELRNLFLDKSSNTYQLYRFYVDEFLDLPKSRIKIENWKTKTNFNHNLQRISRMFECFRTLALPELSQELFELVGEYNYSIRGQRKRWRDELPFTCDFCGYIIGFAKPGEWFVLNVQTVLMGRMLTPSLLLKIFKNV